MITSILFQCLFVSKNYFSLEANGLGAVLHIFVDSWNSYGVHPFWPISSRWIYGDFVFILILLWQVPLVNQETRLVLLAATLFIPLGFSRIPESKRIFAALGVSVALLLFLWISKLGVRQTIAQMNKDHSYDTAMVRLPGNPFC